MSLVRCRTLLPICGSGPYPWLMHVSLPSDFHLFHQLFALCSSLSNSFIFHFFKLLRFPKYFVLHSSHILLVLLCLSGLTFAYIYLNRIWNWINCCNLVELSEVLWKMVFTMAFSIKDWYGSIFLFVIFAFWAALTVGILVLIEGLSAFLHTLRLHW